MYYDNHIIILFIINSYHLQIIQKDMYLFIIYFILYL